MGSDGHQPLVARGVAAAALMTLEVMDVEEQHRWRRRFPAGPGQRLREAVLQQQAVGSPVRSSCMAR